MVTALGKKGGDMKIVLGIVAMFFVGVVYGETSFTYEKVDNDVIKIVEVETTKTISTTNITIKSLKTKIENFKEQKANALEYYNEATAKLDKEIAFVQAQIDKAKEMGVEE